MRSPIPRASLARGVAVICAAVVAACAPSITRAAGVVGTGTAASCTDAAFNAALAGGGSVTFNCGGPATIDISMGTGTKVLHADTTIDGRSLITIGGGNTVAGFDVRPGATFTMRNLAVANALNWGIGNFGTTTVTNSTFTDNLGAGVANGRGSLAVVTDSTFTGNGGYHGTGGGILNLGTLTVTNSTFASGKCFGGCGAGGINNFGGTLTVTNSTFTGNSATLGSSGIGNDDGTIVLRNTIVANGSSADNCSGTITDGGHNLDDGTSCGFSTANASLSGTDPLLDPAGLQDNGGPTHTVVLCRALSVPVGCTGPSPAIDAGDQVVCAAAAVNNLDQRGFVRPGIGHTQCSIGAYEAQGTGPEACIGDCDAGGSVTVDEILTLVNIPLGSAQPSACLNGVPSGAEVNVALILQAVNSALDGCRG